MGFLHFVEHSSTSVEMTGTYMPVLVSGFLVIIVWLYVAMISRWHIFWNVSFLQPIKEFMQGRMVLAHGIVIGIAVGTSIIAVMTMFRVREQTMVVGSKRILLVIALLSVIAIFVLALKIIRIEIPFIEGYLARVRA